jgi:hypothetical protein
MNKREFQIALSFAGEDRNYVDEVANLLKSSGISVFYDLFEEANLWGKNLYDYLIDIYQNKALYTIMFISKSYASKLWTNHERQAMQSRAFQENQEYILPARFDDTKIDGILPTVGYIDLRNKTSKEFVEIIKKKLILSGETIPSQKDRNALFSYTSIPRGTAFDSHIKINDASGLPLKGITITAIAENATYKQADTDEKGIATIDIQTRRLYTLLVADKCFPGMIIEKWDPINNLDISLQETEKIGSIICHSACYIPDFSGRLNIILDTSFRTYLYADNIVINGGMQQPATFKVGEPLILEDSNGVIMKITVKYIQGRTSLVEYIHN